MWYIISASPGGVFMANDFKVFGPFRSKEKAQETWNTVIMPTLGSASYKFVKGENPKDYQV